MHLSSCAQRLLAVSEPAAAACAAASSRWSAASSPSSSCVRMHSSTVVQSCVCLPCMPLEAEPAAQPQQSTL